MTEKQLPIVERLKGGGFVSAQSEYVVDATAAGPIYMKNADGVAVKVLEDGQIVAAGLPLNMINKPTRKNDFIVEPAPAKAEVQAAFGFEVAKPSPPVSDAFREAAEIEANTPIAVAPAIVQDVVPQKFKLNFVQQVEEFIRSGYTSLKPADEQKLAGMGLNNGFLLRDESGTIVRIKPDGDYEQVYVLPKPERKIAIGGSCDQNKKVQQLLDEGYQEVQEYFEVPNAPPNTAVHYMAPNGNIIAVTATGKVIPPSVQQKPMPGQSWKQEEPGYVKKYYGEEEAKKAEVPQPTKTVKPISKNPHYKPKPGSAVNAAKSLMEKLGIDLGKKK